MKSNLLSIITSVQVILIVALLSKVEQLDSRLSELSAQHSSISTANAVPAAAPVSGPDFDTEELAEEIRFIVAEELEVHRSFASEKNTHNEISHSPEKLADAQIALDNLIANGDISDQTLANFEVKLIKLPEAQRKRLLNQLSKRLIQENLYIQ